VGEAIVRTCDRETRAAVWERFLAGRALDAAKHSQENHVLQVCLAMEWRGCSWVYCTTGSLFVGFTSSSGSSGASSILAPNSAFIFWRESWLNRCPGIPGVFAGPG
jgi:hypothetical protein